MTEPIRYYLKCTITYDCNITYDNKSHNHYDNDALGARHWCIGIIVLLYFTAIVFQ